MFAALCLKFEGQVARELCEPRENVRSQIRGVTDRLKFDQSFKHEQSHHHLRGHWRHPYAVHVTLLAGDA